MKKLITISREFGSGGREIGKRLSDYMDIPFYDHEIIELLAEQQDLTTAYVSSVSERHVKLNYSATIGHKFTMHYPAADEQLKMIHAQEQLLRALASQDCIIVGRAADVILSDLRPFNIFVYADNTSKVKRCLERANPAENLTAEQMQHKMRAIDRQRSSYHALFSDTEWGKKENYHLCINTSGAAIKSLIRPLAAYAVSWMEGSEDNDEYSGLRNIDLSGSYI